MRLCRFDDDRLGIVRGDKIVDVTRALEGGPPIRPWSALRADWMTANLATLRPSIEHVAAEAGPGINLSSVSLRSPVANPGKIIGAPGNYLAHVDEVNATAEINFGNPGKTIDHYGLFLKATSSVVGPSDGIRTRFQDRRSDYEGELAVVIGAECRDVPESGALAHVAGYCAGLDMTVRGPEERSFRKSVDSYTVLGPWLTTADEVGDPGDLMIHLELNGEPRQHCSTSHLIWGVAKLVAYASSFYTLHPGDVILTGTPPGVGAVQAGDVIDLGIEKVGEMRVRVG